MPGIIRKQYKGLAFINADEIARAIAVGGKPGPVEDVRAAREMLRRLDDLAAAKQGFAFETTLAS